MVQLNLHVSTHLICVLACIDKVDLDMLPFYMFDVFPLYLLHDKWSDISAHMTVTFLYLVYYY